MCSTRRVGYRTGHVLHHGSRIHRLCSPVHVHFEHGILHHSCQKQSRLRSAFLLSRRQVDGTAQRSDDCSQRTKDIGRIPDSSPSHQLLRRRHQQAACFSNEQLHASGVDYPTTLQVPLARGTFFQMDKAVPSNQGVFRHVGERGKDSDMDCNQCLRACCHHQEGVEARPEFGRNPANSQHFTFRKSLCATITCDKSVAKGGKRPTQPVVLVQLITGQ